MGRVILDHVVVVPTYPDCDTKCLVSDHWRQVGGPVPVALSTASHYGVETTFLGPWGEDTAGEEVAKVLSDRGVDISCCQPSGATGFAQIWTEQATGKRTIAAYPGDAMSLGTMTTQERGRLDRGLASCAILHLDGSSASVAKMAAERMKEQDGWVVLDAGSKKPGMEGLLPLVDVLVASDLFCRSWFGRVDVPRDELLGLVHGAVIRTLGAKGAIYFDGEQELHESAVDVQPVDTNGAGDIFCGAFLTGIAKGWETASSLAFANTVAGYSCRFKGNTTLPPAS